MNVSISICLFVCLSICNCVFLLSAEPETLRINDTQFIKQKTLRTTYLSGEEQGRKYKLGCDISQNDTFRLILRVNRI